MKRLCESLGIGVDSQMKKIKNDPKYDYKTIKIPSRDNKKHSMFCIHFNHINGWLFSINPQRVHKNLRKKLLFYQHKCFSAIHEYWSQGHDLQQEYHEFIKNIPDHKIIAEKDYQELLVERFKTIKAFKNYKFIDNEYSTEAGFIDILAYDKSIDEYVIIELKKGYKNPARQLFHYEREIDGDPILIAVTELPVKKQNDEILYYTFEELLGEHLQLLIPQLEVNNDGNCTVRV